MPSSQHVDHKDTLDYIPTHHRAKHLSREERTIVKSLEERHFHEGRVVDPSYLANTNIRETFARIQFDCLLDIDEQICPLFVLEFYMSIDVQLDRNNNTTIHFKANGNEYHLTLAEFAEILRIPNQGTCMYTDTHSLQAIDRFTRMPNPTVVDKGVIMDEIFNRRLNTNRTNRQGEIVTDNPLTMKRSELKDRFHLWENILRNNAISVVGNRDHIGACLAYMIYSLHSGRPFNLAYYIANRMNHIRSLPQAALPYGMLLTRLYNHLAPIPVNSLGKRGKYKLVDHVMTPISANRVYRTASSKGKRVKPPTSSSSSSSPSSEEDEDLPKSSLDPVDYYRQLPAIPNASQEFKQTKGMFKNLGKMMSKIYKKISK